MAEQCLHRGKAFSASHTAPPASRLGVRKKWGGDTAGTVSDPGGGPRLASASGDTEPDPNRVGYTNAMRAQMIKRLLLPRGPSGAPPVVSPCKVSSKRGDAWHRGATAHGEERWV